jgi:uncharacterized protein YbjT (DUF2867 family)
MILVTGATGNVGGELVRQIVKSNRPVRALIRDGRKDNLWDVEAVQGDLNKPESLRPAFRGVRAVFLLGGYPDMPGILAEARRAGVEHVVLLSSRSVERGVPTNAVVSMWLKSEDAVRSSELSWTILRPSGFMSNALRWASEIRRQNVVRGPFAQAPIAVIDPSDIAAVALATITSNGHQSKIYALSGPEALRPADQVRVLAAVLEKPLSFEAQPDDEAREEMAKSMPPDFVDAFFRFFVDGEFDDSNLVPTVEQIAGRKPRTFEHWARAHADAFRRPVANLDGTSEPAA